MSEIICGWSENTKIVGIKMGLLLYDRGFISFFDVKRNHVSEIPWEILGLKECPPNFLNGL